MAFDKPQSRNEAILQNMLGANNELEPPKSRVEALLQDIAGQMPEANPSEGTTTGTLERLKIGDDIYTVEGGGSGASDYDALNNKPQIAGTTLSGNKSLADLGIASATAVSGILDGTDIDSFGDVETALGDKVDKVEGKGLSTNDYDDTEKAAVAAATTAIAGIKDGTTIDSFADVETALAGKQDATDNSLETEDKTIVGAINENAGDIGSLKSGLTNVESKIDDATTYPYADVITIEDAVPSNLADCSVKIEPVQSGSGDPSPTNVRPITGHTEVDVQRVGKNRLEKIKQGAIDTTTGEEISGANGITEYIPVNPSGVYTMSQMETANYNLRVFYYDANKTFIESVLELVGDATTCTFTVGATTHYIRIQASNNKLNPVTPYKYQLEAGQTATPYEPYQGKTYTIALGDTIYGGKVRIDKNGNTVMDVDDVKKVVDGTEGVSGYGSAEGRYGISISGISNANRDNSNISDRLVWHQVNDYTTLGDGEFMIDNVVIVRSSSFPTTGAEDMKTYLAGLYSDGTPLEFVFKLATPFTVQLTPQQIQLLKGQNTLTASTGQISVTVNGVSGSIGQVQEQVNELAEDVAEIKTLDYSTTEQKTGQKWIDGKDIYFRVNNTPISIIANDSWYNSGFTGIDTVIDYIVSMTRDSENIGSTFNNGHVDYVNRNNEVLIKGTNFTLTDNYVVVKQILYYTKTT